jgi:hypothetical protein
MSLLFFECSTGCNNGCDLLELILGEGCALLILSASFGLQTVHCAIQDLDLPELPNPGNDAQCGHRLCSVWQVGLDRAGVQASILRRPKQLQLESANLE